MQYVYLHGFASSPDSTKARFFAHAFQRRDLPLLRPDLNNGDFSHLTVTAQLEQLRSLLSSFSTHEEITLIGSSMGGLVSLLYSRLDSRVRRLVLMAPAVNFHRILKQKVGPYLKQWKKDRYIPVEHYGYGRTFPMHFGLYSDALQYRKATFTRPLPALIIHGRNDDTVPYRFSIELLEQNPKASLLLLNSDHSLNGSLEWIDSQIDLFFERPFK